jgi:hypothetical protein
MLISTLTDATFNIGGRVVILLSDTLDPENPRYILQLKKVER